MNYNERATKLYKKLGFEVEGEKVQSLVINGQPVNELYLYKLL
ncbi:GNAT family N-acetyltransferase [Bacillus sp. N9]